MPIFQIYRLIFLIIIIFVIRQFQYLHSGYFKSTFVWFSVTVSKSFFFALNVSNFLIRITFFFRSIQNQLFYINVACFVTKNGFKFAKTIKKNSKKIFRIKLKIWISLDDTVKYLFIVKRTSIFFFLIIKI